MNGPAIVHIARWDFRGGDGDPIDQGAIIRTNRTQIYIPHDRLIEFANFMVDTFEQDEGVTE